MPAAAPGAQTTAASIGARTLDASWACAGLVAGRSAVRARKSRPVRSAAPTVSPTPLVRAGALGAATADGEPWHALSASHDAMAACAEPTRAVRQFATGSARAEAPRTTDGTRCRGGGTRSRARIERAGGRKRGTRVLTAGRASGRKTAERAQDACVRERGEAADGARSHLQLCDLRLLGLQLGAQAVNLQ